MNENAKKVFDILDIELDEKFKIEGYDGTFHFSQELNLYNENDDLMDISLQSFINGTNKIIKLPKEPKEIKKKLKDLTFEELVKWGHKKCNYYDCENCIFNKVSCNIYSEKCWIHHKEIYNNKFINQEIEVEVNE